MAAILDKGKEPEDGIDELEEIPVIIDKGKEPEDEIVEQLVNTVKHLTLVVVPTGNKCSKCKKSLPETEFRKKRDGTLNRQCNACLDANRCEHNRQKNKCPDCDGSARCEHHRERSACKECGGGSICTHGKVRSRCRACKGGSYCHHNKRRQQCVECKGSSMCEHGRQRYGCRECDGGAFCEHGKRRYQCRDCDGGAFCKHSKYKSMCEECGGSAICPHGKNKYKCRRCGGGHICDHNKERSKCPVCDPIGHLASIVRCRIRSALDGNKTMKTVEYLGCDIATFRTHLESKFKDGMSWDNYGQWEIDHIIPIKYNNPTMEEVVTRLHWTNTQPMWQSENSSKGNRFIG